MRSSIVSSSCFSNAALLPPADPSMDEDVRAHLEFFQELGIDGVRLEPEWRTRDDQVVESVEVFTSPAAALDAIRQDLGADCSR